MKGLVVYKIVRNIIDVNSLKEWHLSWMNEFITSKNEKRLLEIKRKNIF